MELGSAGGAGAGAERRMPMLLGKWGQQLGVTYGWRGAGGRAGGTGGREEAGRSCWWLRDARVVSRGRVDSTGGAAGRTGARAGGYRWG